MSVTLLNSSTYSSALNGNYGYYFVMKAVLNSQNKDNMTSNITFSLSVQTPNVSGVNGVMYRYGDTNGFIKIYKNGQLFYQTTGTLGQNVSVRDYGRTTQIISFTLDIPHNSNGELILTIDYKYGFDSGAPSYLPSDKHIKNLSATPEQIYTMEGTTFIKTAGGMKAVKNIYIKTSSTTIKKVTHGYIKTTQGMKKMV